MCNDKQKPMPSDRETEQDKLEATKRKLQERYREAEKGSYKQFLRLKLILDNSLKHA